MTTGQKALVFYLGFGCAYGVYNALVDYFPLLGPYPFATHTWVWLLSGEFLVLFAGLGVPAYELWRTRRYSWATLALQIVQLVDFAWAGTSTDSKGAPP